jgi:hypothetical protein
MEEKNLKAKNGMGVLIVTVLALILSLVLVVFGGLMMDEGIVLGIPVFVIGLLYLFLGWIPLSIILMTVSSLLFFAVSFFNLPYQLLFVSLALVAVCLFFIVTEFLFYKETLDPFCKKKTSYNAYGYRKASDETKRRIIFAGHADSSMEWRFTYYGGPKLVIPIIGGSLLGIVVSLVCNIFVVIKCAINPEFVESTAVSVISYVLVAFIVIYLAASLFYDKK